MKNECSVIKDLLPLYAENMTSADTAAFVAEHLRNCENCRAEYEKTKDLPQTTAEPAAAAPLKELRKKLIRKRLLIAAGAVLGTLLVLFGAFVFFEARPTQVLLQQAGSELYSDAEINSAAQEIIKDFEHLEGCKLYSLTYAGDERSRQELAYINQFGNYDQCIVFDSVFRSPLFGGGAWSAHEIYTWSWYLGRVYGGEWEVVQRGYA